MAGRPGPERCCRVACLPHLLHNMHMHILTSNLPCILPQGELEEQQRQQQQLEQRLAAQQRRLEVAAQQQHQQQQRQAVQ